MFKISVIVPVYNTEKYIKKCLDSILIQKSVELEIIVVNDGSTDGSADILRKYEASFPSIIRYYEKINGGLSDARNYGIEKATGDFLCFVDSDDYIAEDLFESISMYLAKDIDLVKYKCIKVDENSNVIEKVDGPVFENKTGGEAFNTLYSTDVLLEPAWLYLYRKEYFLENKYRFPVGRTHEDWAIVPFIVLNAKSVVSTEYYGYYYVQSSNSITRNNSDEKIRKRAYDMLEHYDDLFLKLSDIEIDEHTRENFLIYMSNCLILKLNELPEKYQKEYISELKKRKIADNIKARNLKQLLKKTILKINIKLYLKMR